ncbi:MucBP domain-containing protein, partial [Enterococcus plantarum]|uniref:MucBP domain-containing protein n=1 Tax=Enterococcus plantarum TaxID=1077675 RepID=UPI001F5F8A16
MLLQNLFFSSEVLAVVIDNPSSEFKTAGTANYSSSDDTFTLTQNSTYKVGSISLKKRISVNSDFSLKLSINLGSNPNGADGIGISLHSGSVDQTGRFGPELGIGGLPNAVGFAFDTYHNGQGFANTPLGRDPLDANNRPIIPYFQTWKSNSSGVLQRTSTAAQLPVLDGNFYPVEISYVASSKEITVTYRGNSFTQVVTSSNYPNGMVLSVSASTGSLFNIQQVKVNELEFLESKNVSVLYQDTEGNVISDGISLSGKIGEPYTTEQKAIEGYTFKEVHGNPSGIYTESEQIVTYIYTKNPVAGGDVTASYVDESGNEISSKVVLTGNVGESYTTEQKTIEGYTFKEVQGNPSGTFTESEQTVTYIYTKDPVAGGDVTASYVDESGNEISSKVVLTGNVGESYTTEQKTIEGYTFKEVQGNPSGTFTESEQTVIYIYTKNH